MEQVWRITPRALPAPNPRRDPRPAADLGRRGQARAPEEGGAGMEGAVALQRGEDAVLLRERPEAVLPLLLLGKAWGHLHLSHGDGGPVLPRGRGAAGRRGGCALAATLPRGPAGGGQAQEPP